MKARVSHWVRALATVVLATAWVNCARAAYDYTVLGDGGLVGGFSVSLDGNAESGILVGGIHIVGNPSVPGYANATTVCVDLNGRVYVGSTYAFNEVGFSGQTGLNPAWGQPTGNSSAAYQAINNAAYLYATYHPTTATDWAALQLAVWKAVYDTSADGSINWDASSERFTVTTDVNNAWVEAQGFLASLPRNTDYLGYLLQPEDDTAQEFLIAVTPMPVPEASTIATGLLLLMPFGPSSLRFLRRRLALRSPAAS